MNVAGPEATASDANVNLLPGDVVDVVNMGAEIHYIVESAEGRLMAVEPNREGPRVHKGDRVGLRFRAEDCVVLSGEDA